MSTADSDIGVVGLGVMGRNLALNLADHGFAVAVYNRTQSALGELAGQLSAGQRVRPCETVEELVGSLKRPRRLMVMVKAGQPVDAIIGQLEGLLDRGDVVIDGGNSHFSDTERRARSLAAGGVHFLGVGISGGEQGARHGPSIMPGGAREAYEAVRAIFEAIAARVDGEPCVAYLGPGGAGHFVKMVHNGIEYGFMQLIADSYALLKQVLHLTNEESAAVYADWNTRELSSFLVEITADILRRRDDKTGAYLIDFIADKAGQLGTGMWASQSAMDLHVPVPNIDVAVAMRNLSALDAERTEAAALLGPTTHEGRAVRATSGWQDSLTGAGPLVIDTIRDALFSAMVISYAQGFAHLQAASRAFAWDLRLEGVASIWRGGCIVRAALLGDIKVAFQRRPGLPNLLLDPGLAESVSARRSALARAVEAAINAGVPVPGLMTALAYFDGYRAGWSPLSLIQAQRDYFGAHTYTRVDVEGVFHTDWLSDQKRP